jgi:formiminotetrahydrofolate cyclodeaminase
VTRFADLTVAQLLDALASPDPTPGGGTASAIAGAMGASLLIMVTGLAKSKTNTEDEKTALQAARLALEPLRAEMTRLADADSDAFDQVMAAYRRPKVTDEEKAARTSAIQTALRQATVVPLETLRACAAAMPLAAQVAEAGNRSAASDAGVAVGLLEAAAAGAEANVRINLEGLKDEGFNANVSSEVARLAAELGAAARAARQALATV